MRAILELVKTSFENMALEYIQYKKDAWQENNWKKLGS